MNIANKASSREISEREEVPDWARSSAPANAPSKAQHDFIDKLVNEKDLSKLSDEQQMWIALYVKGDAFISTKQAAGRIIGELVVLPRKPVAGTSGVPEGRYAIEQDGVVKFYRVSKPTEGRWAGYVFVQIQASDDLYPIKNKTTREAILLEIAKDPQAAMLRYGQEIGSCGHCGRTLTNEESREFGIGPICRQKMGW